MPELFNSITLEEEGAGNAECFSRTHGPRASKVARGGYHRFSRDHRHSLRDGVNAYT
jgi:hypothetical protein